MSIADAEAEQTEHARQGHDVSADHYRRQLEAIATNATLALFIMDERQYCTFMNLAAERLTGYRLVDVQGQPLHNYVHYLHPDGTPYPLEDCPIDRAFPQNMREVHPLETHGAGCNRAAVAAR